MITFRGVDASTPIEEREQFSKELSKNPIFPSVLLSTCDRVELYKGDGAASKETLLHLFRVVSGLESPMLGENQIQAQVKRAYLDASEQGSLPAGFHRLFQTALKVGKRVRTETGISKGATGHAQTVVKLLKTSPKPIKDLNVVVVGVNNLSRGILKYLIAEGNKTFLLGNRTLLKAEQFCQELQGGEAIPLTFINEKLVDADVVICATSAPHLILHDHQLPAHGGPTLFFDLAVPRDIDPQIALRPGATLYNVQDLEAIAKQTLKDRNVEVIAAEKIIAEELEKFLSQYTEPTLSEQT